MEKNLRQRNDMFIYVALGLLLGLGINLFVYFQYGSSFLYSSLLFFCLFYGVTYDNKNSGRLVLTSLLTAMVISSPLIYLRILEQGSSELKLHEIPEFGYFITFLIGFPFFVYMGHAFHYSFHHDNTWKIRYPTLFSAVWNTFILLIVASIFAGIAGGLIAMAASIFSAAGNTWLWTLYHQNFYVGTFIHTTLFFVGLGIAQQNEKIISNLRFLLLRMMHFLFPLLAIISIIYFVLYLLSGNQNMNKDIILIVLSILGIIFFNAHFQTGKEDNHYAPWLKHTLKLYHVALLIAYVFAAYKLATTATLPINFGLYLLVILLYCFSYAIAVFLNTKQSTNWIMKTNQGIALFFVIAMLIINNPIHPLFVSVG